MQFLSAMFGASTNTVLTMVLALGVVLVLIVLGVWLLKVVFKASSSVGRGRNRRLSVVDTLMIDPRRQLLIVRRDNVEHLILTGGPQDVVVETGISNDKPAAQRPVAPQPAAKIAEAVAPASLPPASPRAGAAAEIAQTLAQVAPLPAPPAPERVPEPLTMESPRRAPLLRETGLMRPEERLEPAVIPMSPEVRTDNSIRPETDSARTMPLMENGQVKLGVAKPRLFADVVHTDRN